MNNILFSANTNGLKVIAVNSSFKNGVFTVKDQIIKAKEGKNNV